MKAQLKTALLASAFAFSAVVAVPANADIEMANASDFQGEIVLIDASVGTTGGVILGHTNQSHVSVTYDGMGDTLKVGGTGQSFLTGTGGTLTKLNYFLTDGGTFNNTEFKISGATSTIDFFVTDNFGATTPFTDVALDSSGFIAFRGINGQSIKSLSFTVDNNGTFEEFRQLRLDVDGAQPVPEPASWALMLGGFGLIGGALRRRRAPADNVCA